MRYLDTYKLIKILMLCLIVALTSCEQSTNPANDTSIKLAPADGTEAEGQAATETATVWAYKTAGENSSWLFNCGTDGRGATIDMVDKTIALNIENDETAVPTEYWSNDKYTFFSLWPHVTGASATAGDDLTFSFNAVENQIDQLASFNNYVIQGDATRTETVNFIYDHALAKIYIKLTKNNANNDDVVKLRKVTLKGFYPSGTCTVSNTISWVSGGDKDTTEKVLYEATVDNALTLKKNTAYTVGATTDVDGGYLVIPQSVTANTIMLTVDYDFYRTSASSEENPTIEDVERESKSISTYLPNATIKQWAWGKKHTYNCILKAESSKILFTTPDIEPWNKKQVGGTIIIQ